MAVIPYGSIEPLDVPLTVVRESVIVNPTVSIAISDKETSKDLVGGDWKPATWDGDVVSYDLPLLDIGTYRVWVKVEADPYTVIREAGTLQVK